LLPGQSLAKLLLVHRQKRHRNLLPKLTTAQILAWADAHHKRTGTWPLDHSGPIRGAPGETWNAVHKALIRGRRGLPGGSSLARFLEKHRGVRNRLSAPRLTIERILRWVDAHHKRTGRWPIQSSGVVPGNPNETWAVVNAALVAGTRGLPRGGSLARLLARHRGVRNVHGLPALSVAQIRSWAQAHERRTGQRPRVKSGAIPEAPGETWAGIDQALRLGRRGLPTGFSLYRLLSGRPAQTKVEEKRPAHRSLPRKNDQGTARRSR
jgi:hypothetical protein